MNVIDPSRRKAPIHSILSEPSNYSEKNKLLETLLTYGDVDVDLKDLDENTPLDLAIKVSTYCRMYMYLDKVFAMGKVFPN